MYKLSYEIDELLKNERDTVSEDERNLGPAFLMQLLQHESIFLHESNDDCFSSIYPDFVDGRAIIYTTLVESTGEILTIASLENPNEDWDK